jgi:hypothetical protein
LFFAGSSAEQSDGAGAAFRGSRPEETVLNLSVGRIGAGRLSRSLGLRFIAVGAAQGVRIGNQGRSSGTLISSSDDAGTIIESCGASEVAERLQEVKRL